MRIYQLSFSTQRDGHHSYSYVSNIHEAGKETADAKKNGYRVERHTINLPITKCGLLKALNRYGSHANNG